MFVWYQRKHIIYTFQTKNIIMILHAKENKSENNIIKKNKNIVKGTTCYTKYKYL